MTAANKNAPETGSTGRVLLFRARATVRKDRLSDNNKDRQESAVGDLRKYEHGADSDDYPRRMIINVIAFAFIVLLTTAGVWLAETMALLRQDQDCALSGRRNCTPIDLQARDR